jgi:hypothetical protein
MLYEHVEDYSLLLKHDVGLIAWVGQSCKGWPPSSVTGLWLSSSGLPCNLCPHMVASYGHRTGQPTPDGFGELAALVRGDRSHSGITSSCRSQHHPTNAGRESIGQWGNGRRITCEL